jgi:hypothetical protein
VERLFEGTLPGPDLPTGNLAEMRRDIFSFQAFFMSHIPAGRIQLAA